MFSSFYEALLIQRAFSTSVFPFMQPPICPLSGGNRSDIMHDFSFYVMSGTPKNWWISCVCFQVFLSVLLLGMAAWWWRKEFQPYRSLTVQSFSLKESQDPLVIQEPPMGSDTRIVKVRGVLKVKPVVCVCVHMWEIQLTAFHVVFPLHGYLTPSVLSFLGQ